MKRRVIILAASIILAVFAGEALPAEDEEASPRKLGGLLIRETDTPANSLLSKADDLKAKGEYEGAIAAYQHVLQTYPSALYPSTAETFQGRLGVTYVSAREYVEEQMGSLPEEARKIYSTLYEARAKGLFEEGEANRDPEPLLKASRLFPISPSGIRSLGLLARWDLERGRWDAAATGFRSVLRRDRFRWDRRIPEVLSLGIALTQGGRREGLSRFMADVDRFLEGEGKARVLADLGALLLRIPASPDDPFWVNRYGVDEQGRGVTAPAVPDVPLCWGAKLPMSPGRRSDPQNTFKNRFAFNVGDLLEEAYRPFFAAVSGDRVYVHNGIEFYCFDLLLGEGEIWKTESEYAHRTSQPDVRQMVGGWNFEPNRIFTCTLVGDVLYVLKEVPADEGDLSSRNYHNYQVIPPIPRRRLTALNAHTGKLLWETGARERPLSFLDRISFSSEPVAFEGRLYLAGAAFEGIPTAFVVCLDAETGEEIWIRRVCAGSQELNMFGRPVREYCGSPISVCGNAVYFATNLGAVASLRASDGEWRWLFRYPPQKKAKSETFETVKVPPAWAMTHIVATAERVVVAPTDAENLFALDTESGLVRWAWTPPRNDQVPRWGWGRGTVGGRAWLNGPFYFLGESEGKVVVHGSNVAAYSLRSGKLVWRSLFANEEERPAGKGAIAGGRVYVPTTAALYVYDLENGRCVLRKGWANPETQAESGNVIVAGGYLLTLTRDRLNCYCDRTRLETRIKEDVKTRPRDPMAALRAARVCRRNRNLKDALVFYRKALDLSGAESAIGREARLGLYQGYLEQGREAKSRNDREEAVGFFRQALEFAPGTDEKISTTLDILEHYRRKGADEQIVKIYADLARDHPDALFPFDGEPVPVEIWSRFSLARHWASTGRASRAVQEYQGLIERFGAVPFRMGASKGTVRQLGVEDVEKLIALHGRRVYTSFDEKAQALFDRGIESGEPEVLETILDRYPNSRVFGPALLALGRLFLSKGDFPRAGEQLKAYLREYPRSAETPTALFLLVRALEEQGRHYEARRVLIRMKKHFPFAPLQNTEKGLQEAGAWAAERLERQEYRKARVAEVRADVAWEGGKPLWERAFKSRPVLMPIEGVRPIEQEPLVVVMSGRDLQGLSTQRGEAIWSLTATGDPRGAAWAGDTLVVEEAYRIWALDADKGKQKWSRTFSTRGVVKGMTVKGDIIAAMVSDLDGRPNSLWLAVMDGDSGRDVFPPKNLEQWGNISVPQIGIEVVAAYIREGTPRIFAFDLVDGRELMAHAVRGWLQCTPVLFEEEKRLVYCTPDAVVGLDLSGRTIWTFEIRGVDRDSLLSSGETVAVTRLAENGRHEVLAFKVKDGAVLWRRQTGMHNLRFREAVDGAFFVVGSQGREELLLRLEGGSGEVGAKVLINNRPSFSPLVTLGKTVGVAKIVWREGRTMEGAFRIFSLDTGKILEILKNPGGNLAERYGIVDGKIIFTKGNALLAWGK